jgi:hypothetical protein
MIWHSRGGRPGNTISPGRSNLRRGALRRSGPGYPTGVRLPKLIFGPSYGVRWPMNACDRPCRLARRGNSRRFRSAVKGERAPDIVALLNVSLLIAADVALIAMRLDQDSNANTWQAPS